MIILKVFETTPDATGKYRTKITNVSALSMASVRIQVSLHEARSRAAFARYVKDQWLPVSETVCGYMDRPSVKAKFTPSDAFEHFRSSDDNASS